MAKTATLTEESTPQEATSKIEKIKNLIFGEDIASYNAEFEQVKKDILSKKKELEDFIDDTRKELNQAIDNLGTDLNIRITDLQDSLNTRADDLEQAKVDKEALGALLISMGEKLKRT